MKKVLDSIQGFYLAMLYRVQSQLAMVVQQKHMKDGLGYATLVSRTHKAAQHL